jgi:hypothetical protein
LSIESRHQAREPFFSDKRKNLAFIHKT